MMIPKIRLAAALLALASAHAACGAEPEADGGSDDRAAMEASLREHCKTSASPCRENLQVVLRRDGGETYDRTFALLPPAVQPHMISVHPGEIVRAVPLFENERFAGWRAPRADEPADTQILTIDLDQMDDKAGMMASVSTNTGPALKLRMGLVRLDGSDEPESTSSCPLRAGGWKNFEMWPYPIFVLLVADAARPTPEDEGVCR
ncbi:MAG: hypothetical protein ACOY82_11815 [Pseudomonadota bacterium]